VNPGGRNDGIDHYNVTVAVGSGGEVHVAYRQRDEHRNAPLFSPWIDTFYQQSRDGGKTFSAPLKVDVKPSNAYYDAFSRNGSFEGDYNQTTSAGGFTYVTRTQGERLRAGEPQALVKNPDGSDTVVLTNKGKGHQHQRNWVALIRDLAAGAGCVGSNSPRTTLKRVVVADRHVTVSGSARDLGCGRGIARVELAIARHVVREDEEESNVHHPDRCRFADRSGDFGPPVKCTHRLFIRADGTSSWVLALAKRVSAGNYEVWARSVTRAGSRERLTKRNHRSFAVR
jgi:hypothetical protein